MFNEMDMRRAGLALLRMFARENIQALIAIANIRLAQSNKC